MVFLDSCFRYFSCLLILMVEGSTGDSSIEIILSENSPIRIGSNLTIYCVTVNSSNIIEWYKRVGNDASRADITNTNGTRIRQKFSSTRRYSVDKLDMGVRPSALEITNVQKADEGTIGCRNSDDFAEVTFEVLGSVTEVFVDIKPYGLREESYTIPGEVVVIPLPQPDYGYTVRCHVQATTTNVTIAMKLAGREVPARDTPWAADPENSDPLQERIYVRHKEIQNIKPAADMNQARLECIASSPNYPLVEVRNYVNLNVYHKPTGGCSVLQPEDYTGTITIKCTIHYNPSFIDAKWKLQSTNQEFSGYPTSSQNVTTYYSTHGHFNATFYLRLKGSASMSATDIITLRVVSSNGYASTFNVGIRRPPEPLPTTSPTAQQSSASTMQTKILMAVTVENLPVYSSGDRDDDSSSTENTYSETLIPLTRSTAPSSGSFTSRRTTHSPQYTDYDHMNNKTSTNITTPHSSQPKSAAGSRTVNATPTIHTESLLLVIVSVFQLTAIRI